MSTTHDDTQIEQLLRSTLATRADAVTSGPAWQPPTQPRRTPPNRYRHRMLMPLAAAAAVAAVAVSLTLTGDRINQQAPATQAPTRSHTGAPSSPAPNSSPPHTTKAPPPPEACAATLPDAWSSALEHAALPVGGITPEVLSMTPDGTAVALRDNGPLPGSSRQVVLLAPGQSPRTVYTVPDPDRLNVQSAQVSGHWLVVAVKDDGRPGPNSIPGSSPMPNVRKLVVVDLRSGATKQIAATPESGMGEASTGAYVIGGVVYWDTRPSYTATHGEIHSYDLATGAAKVVYRGSVGYPVYGPAGVLSVARHDEIWMVRASLPPAVAADLTPGTAGSLATDGTNFAWLETRRVLAWWGPGQSPVRIQLRHPLSATDTGALAVSGRFVVTTDGDLVDTASRASAPITGAAVYAGDGRGDISTGAGGYLAGQGYPNGSGHYVNGYWEDPVPTALRVKAGSLPALTC